MQTIFAHYYQHLKEFGERITKLFVDAWSGLGILPAPRRLIRCDLNPKRVEDSYDIKSNVEPRQASRKSSRLENAAVVIVTAAAAAAPFLQNRKS